jgi:hypothetical protein
MKYILIILVLPLLAESECSKKKLVISACIEQKINEIKAAPKWNPPAEVNEYVYQDKRVYLFSSPCCDQYNMLYDENCTAICAPSGGYTGRGDQKCVDFKEVAKHVKVVWKDER